MTVKKWSVLVLVGFFPLLLVAEETGLRFSIGPIYREFGEVDFRATSFPSANDPFTQEAPFGIQNYTTISNPAPGRVAVDYVTVDPVDLDDDNISTGDKFGPIIGVELDVQDYVDMVLSFVANFQFFSIHGDTSGDGRFSAVNIQQRLAGENVTPAIPGLDTPTPGLSPGTSFQPAVSQDFDMELYVVDAGVKLSVNQLDPVRVGLAVGPTLSIGDAETSNTLSSTASWRSHTIPSETISSSTTDRTRRSDVDVIFGLYTALEGQIRINESVSIGAGFRYDWASREAGTSQANVDLQTFGGYGRLIIDF